jgi:hypothetical protein
VAGRLRSVGFDVATLQVEGEEAGVAYVVVSSLRAETNVNKIG